ncbi:hypothetical protein FACS18945_5660 [Bacteroidia bacterium]|nr:hypothetical protein FACS18945_5660 [Bacteroidia bacterium]
MLIIAMFIFSACENEVNVTLVTGSSVSKYYVHNGESVTLTVTLAEGAIDEVSFFWDSEKIQTFTAPPYEVTYNVENESIGIHSFSYRAICSRHKGGAAASASTSGAHAIVVEE